jgi:hypothetical protein
MSGLQDMFVINDPRKGYPALLNRDHVVRVEYKKTNEGKPAVHFIMVDGEVFILDEPKAAVQLAQALKLEKPGDWRKYVS